ncbi:TetR family transcriptional regulator [Streptomyces sp. NPDC046831]|uniref:TetR/AcrR family transcriptional regulator n=1 Tax=Streptomyces sp. NPDC046831 TaxID=3154805 RepID=UPI0033C3C17D
MATGHADPQRRERIVAAALDLIADEGVAGVSHRKIAARAGVPLGSMTYHFSGMDELLREAFRHFTDHIVAVFDAHLAGPADREEARAAVADLIHTLSGGSRRDLVLTQELYTLAARRPSYRELTQEWTARSRAHLERDFDRDTARQLDALIKGLTLHRALAREPHDRALTLEAVTRITRTGGGPPSGSPG